MDKTGTNSILQAFLTAGDCAQKLNKTSSAEHFYTEALRFASCNAGSESLETALAYYCLSTFYLEQKRLPEAAFNANAAVNICSFKLGRCHPSTGLILHQLAEICTAQKLYSVAQPIRKRAAEIMEEHLVTLDFSVPTKSISALMMKGVMSADGSWIKGLAEAQELITGEN
jgi:tetratricopeptide (TPR) repeat protein